MTGYPSFPSQTPPVLKTSHLLVINIPEYPPPLSPRGLSLGIIYFLAVKAGIHLKDVFTPPKIGLTEISRSRFKQYKNPTLISQSNVLGCFVNFLVIFRYIWEEIVFLKRVVKFGEIENS